jgi:hypothetical protein
MSWLSSALKNNSVKIGLAIAGAYFGGKYLYGTTGFKGTDPTNPFDYSGVPPDIRLADTGGYGVQGSGSGIAAGQAQMINLGRGGALQQALGRADTQMYLARKVKGLGLPPIAQLPAASGITSTGIRTTSMQSRAYKKLGLTKS